MYSADTAIPYKESKQADKHALWVVHSVWPRPEHHFGSKQMNLIMNACLSPLACWVHRVICNTKVELQLGSVFRYNTLFDGHKD